VFVKSIVELLDVFKDYGLEFGSGGKYDYL
jgi:hypothetical protein